MSKEIFIIRHAKTAFNVAGRLQGQGADSPLVASQAEFAALRNYLSQFDFDLLYTSELPRAQATATQVCPTPDQPFTILADLNEVSFGNWEGETKDSLLASHPVEFAALQRRQMTPALEKHGIEDFDQAAERFVAALNQIAAALPADGRALVVSHGAIIHLGCQKLLKTTALQGLANLSTTVVTNQDGRWRLKAYNETSYLPEGTMLKGNTSLA